MRAKPDITLNKLSSSIKSCNWTTIELSIFSYTVPQASSSANNPVDPSGSTVEEINLTLLTYQPLDEPAKRERTIEYKVSESLITN